jgi:succinate dehydrogenase / fumarate reductase, cytochrome b subunit
MKLFCRIVCSSIGKKVLVALAGLLLCGFLVTHLAGNLFLLVGASAFNHYAETLEENKLLPLAEAGLFALFVLHIVTSLVLRVQDKQARPVAYEMKVSKGGSTWGSSTMALSGILILAFIIVHIKTFKFGDKPDGLFNLVVTWFKNPFYVGFYVLAMTGLGLHLSHGVQSAFRTFGLSHSKYMCLVKKVGLAFAILIAAGFAMLPLWAFFKAEL